MFVFNKSSHETQGLHIICAYDVSTESMLVHAKWLINSNTHFKWMGEQKERKKELVNKMSELSKLLMAPRAGSFQSKKKWAVCNVIWYIISSLYLCGYMFFIVL